jgi:hypothetical protein
VTASLSVTRPYQFRRKSTRDTLATFETHSKKFIRADTGASQASANLPTDYFDGVWPRVWPDIAGNTEFTMMQMVDCSSMTAHSRRDGRRANKPLLGSLSRAVGRSLCHRRPAGPRVITTPRPYDMLSYHQMI